MPERTVGLLFVHGIGEQRRWEHLRATVRDMAELIRADRNDARVSVVDRTSSWTAEPDCPQLSGAAPLSLTVATDAETVRYECHEVWWAGLGAKSGLGDAAAFWFWSLGQWAAPIYRRLDLAASAEAGAAPAAQRREPEVILPGRTAGRFGPEVLTRIALLVAGQAALWTLVSWTLAKQVMGKLFDVAASPTLIVQYLGDVRLYERRPMPGEALASDPGQPLRVPIRRRMVAELVAMAQRGYPQWYVVAHSLGSVIAYNGLTETGHALPNYLSEAQWLHVPPALRTDAGCLIRRPDHIARMMPARPPWLADSDVINRPLLFARLQGVLTYGSPLDKFAALWPRIVATADDRNDAESGHAASQRVFGDCEWLNLAAPHDPVGGLLNAFADSSGQPLGAGLPPPVNIRTPLGRWLGLAHIEYFKGAPRTARDRPATATRRAVTRWLAGERGVLTDRPLGAQWLLVGGQYAALLALLWGATTALFACVRGLIGLFGANDAPHPATAADYMSAFLAQAGPALGVLLAFVVLAGLVLWVREARMNLSLARFDGIALRIAALLRAQAIASTICAALAIPVLGVAIVRDSLPPDRWDWCAAIAGFACVVLAPIAAGIAITAQAVVNWCYRDLG